MGQLPLLDFFFGPAHGQRAKATSRCRQMELREAFGQRLRISSGCSKVNRHRADTFRKLPSLSDGE